jgi:hypothetical protein
MPSDEMVMGCDTFFMIGTSFPYAEWLPDEGTARGVEINIGGTLIGMRYPMEAHLVGDSKETLRQLIPLLRRKEDRSWREEIEKNVRTWDRIMADRAGQSFGGLVNPQAVAAELSPRLPDGAILTSDSGSATNWWARHIVAAFEGFAGYSLPDDLLSGTGLRIADGIMLSVPVVGTYLSFFVFGGQYPGDIFVSRLYVAHVLIIPGLLLALITAHLMVVWHQGHTQWPGKKERDRNEVGEPLYPVFMAKTAALFFFVFGVLAVFGAIAQINPIWLFGRTTRRSPPTRPGPTGTSASLRERCA